MSDMEIADYIDKFKEFIELNYLKDLHRQVSKGKKSLVFDVGELIRFDPDLVEQLLNNPDDFIKAAELAVAQFDIGDLHARFRNFPASEKVAIKDIEASIWAGLLL